MVASSDQLFNLPSTYEWIPEGAVARFLSSALYSIAYPIGRIFLWSHLRWKLNRKEQLHPSGEKGIILYCNHTQPIGDVLLPAYVARPRRIYTLASPSNLGIPIIGKVLKHLGALPIPADRHAFRKFKEAIKIRLAQNSCIVIYPEEHVWPYCTFIRPFNEAAFSFAVDSNVPVYAMTTTYARRRFGKKPQAISYLDGPFFVKEGIARPQARKLLRNQIYECMQERAKSNTYEYCHYVREGCVQ